MRTPFLETLTVLVLDPTAPFFDTPHEQLKRFLQEWDGRLVDAATF